jgi:hypothetical protein
VVHFIGEASVFRRRGPEGARQARRVRDVSLAAFGLVLEDRDLGFLFLLAEVMPEEKYRAQRQHRQQELEEAFHRNLPFPHFMEKAEKVNRSVARLERIHAPEFNVIAPASG